MYIYYTLYIYIYIYAYIYIHYRFYLLHIYSGAAADFRMC